MVSHFFQPLGVVSHFFQPLEVILEGEFPFTKKSWFGVKAIGGPWWQWTHELHFNHSCA
jgi:hypothetical protein